MSDYTHVRCIPCGAIVKLEDRVNNAWTGWNTSGEATKVDNYCCPWCGSNDLVLRAIGVDETE